MKRACGTYRGEEFSCSLKASLVVGPGEGLHMMKLETVHCHSLRYPHKAYAENQDILSPASFGHSENTVRTLRHLQNALQRLELKHCDGRPKSLHTFGGPKH